MAPVRLGLGTNATRTPAVSLGSGAFLIEPSNWGRNGNGVESEELHRRRCGCTATGDGVVAIGAIVAPRRQAQACCYRLDSSITGSARGGASATGRRPTARPRSRSAKNSIAERLRRDPIGNGADASVATAIAIGSQAVAVCGANAIATGVTSIANGGWTLRLTGWQANANGNTPVEDLLCRQCQWRPGDRDRAITPTQTA